jgi:capsular exopolysaccharide synthesis family protein
MSRIFDALKKAEKRKGAAGQVSPDVPTRPAPEAGALEDVPREFITEMGSLRNNIEAAVPKPAGKVVLLTSAVRGEGTSTIAYYLGRVLAADPEVRVVLVDGNLRNPFLHTFFGEDIGTGLSDVLSGSAKWSDAVRKTQWPRLHLLSGGSPDILSTLSVSRLTDLLRDLGTEFTHVVIDTGAVLVSPEATGFFAQADGILLIIQSLKTKREVVLKAVDIITKSRGKILGAFLNRRKYHIPEFIYKRV